MPAACPESLADVAFIAGNKVPSDLLGPLHQVPDWRQHLVHLPQHLARDGYVLLRGALPREDVLSARHHVLEQLAAVGEIAEPARAALATGCSQRAALHPDLGAFWRQVCESPLLRRLTHGPALAELSAAVLDCTSVPFDFLWLRTMVQGRASPLHFDHVYMNRGSQRVVTAWLPLGDVPLRAGPLLVVEGSNRFDDLIARYRGIDVDRHSLPGSFPEDAIAFAQSRQTRLLTTAFQAGDVLLFDMFTLHGSCDNQLAGGQVRLSCDVRWQAAADSRDERWFGHPPPGHGGLSYGGLNGARPLGEAHLAR